MDPKKTAEQIQGQTSSYLSDFAGQSAPHRDVLSGIRRNSATLNETMDKIHSGTCTVHDLAKAHKTSPASPPAVLLKYLAHRVNNVESYHSTQTGHTLDHDFMASVQEGPALQHNSEVTPRHLNEWMLTNPQLLEGALTHKAKIASLASMSGMNVRKINGEPYVAMTRGLNYAAMKNDKPLSSFSDSEDSGAGTTQHHVWMPLSDLWYSFPMSPPSSRGTRGHEGEWLFSNKAQRYLARAQDIKPSYFSSSPTDLDPDFVAIGGLEDDVASELVSGGRVEMDQIKNLHNLGLLGPKTLVAAHKMFGHLPPTFANHPAIPRNIAAGHALTLDGAKPVDDLVNSHALLAMSNPNLQPEDLKTIISSPKFPTLAGIVDYSLVGKAIIKIASHPSFNDGVCSDLVENLKRSPSYLMPQFFLPLIAKNAQEPSMALHRVLIAGLDARGACPYAPAATVAACFANGGAPLAFNNTKNSERYLRALADYFKDQGENAEDPYQTYSAMLSGARMDDTTLQTLVDLSRSGRPLAGTTQGQHDRILADVAESNIHLTPRQLTILSGLPGCADALLHRSNFLPAAVQVNLMTHLKTHEVNQLASRPELSLGAAELILKRASTLSGESLHLATVQVAQNPHIPVAVIEKFVNHESPANFASSVATGLRLRAKRAGVMLPEPPPGGLE
jgi:hypothetical protein